MTGTVRVATVVVLGAALVAGAGGCATGRRSGPLRADLMAPGSGAGVPSCTSPMVVRPGRPAPSRPAQSPAPTPTPLPDDFVPVSAQRCVLGTVVEPGDGEWRVRDEQQATSGLDALVEALRRPSSPRRGDQACPAVYVAPIGLTLSDARGVTIRPAVPHDSCGLPLEAVREAVADLPWKSVKQTKVGRLRGELEMRSGCPGAYKPVVAIRAGDGAGRRSASGPLFAGRRPDALTVCRYRLDPSSKVSMVGHAALAGGVLDTAGKLTGQKLDRFVSAVDAAPAVTARCARPQAPFAVLRPDGGSGPSIVVELGGCRRATDGTGPLRQLDAATVALLG